MKRQKIKKWEIKNFYLNLNPIEARNEKEAEGKMIEMILKGEFEFDVEESEG
jgi:hypothetical protein